MSTESESESRSDCDDPVVPDCEDDDPVVGDCEGVEIVSDTEHNIDSEEEGQENLMQLNESRMELQSSDNEHNKTHIPLHRK